MDDNTVINVPTKPLNEGEYHILSLGLAPIRIDVFKFIRKLKRLKHYAMKRQEITDSSNHANSVLSISDVNSPTALIFIELEDAENAWINFMKGISSDSCSTVLFKPPSNYISHMLHENIDNLNQEVTFEN